MTLENETTKTALKSLTAVLVELIRSDEPDRFLRAEQISKTAQAFIQASTKRVQDFENELSIMGGRGGNVRIRKRYDLAEDQGLVPKDLTDAQGMVIAAFENVMISALEGEKRSRFSEVERQSGLTSDFIDSFAPKKEELKRKRVGGRFLDAHDHQYAHGVGMEDDMMPGDYRRIGDHEQNQRDYLETKAIAQGVEDERKKAEIAANEVRELRELRSLYREMKEDAHLKEFEGNSFNLVVPDDPQIEIIKTRIKHIQQNMARRVETKDTRK